jgi:hypothetical protein
MTSPCLCKPPIASEPASHVKPVTKLPFGRASPGAARGAAPETLPNGALNSRRVASRDRSLPAHHFYFAEISLLLGLAQHGPAASTGPKMTRAGPKLDQAGRRPEAPGAAGGSYASCGRKLAE